MYGKIHKQSRYINLQMHTYDEVHKYDTFLNYNEAKFQEFSNDLKQKITKKEFKPYI